MRLTMSQTNRSCIASIMPFSSAAEVVVDETPLVPAALVAAGGPVDTGPPNVGALQAPPPDTGDPPFGRFELVMPGDDMPLFPQAGFLGPPPPPAAPPRFWRLPPPAAYE